MDWNSQVKNYFNYYQIKHFFCFVVIRIVRIVTNDMCYKRTQILVFFGTIWF